MGQRREPRKQIQLPVRIFGTGQDGRPFSENVVTVDVSREGARLQGVQAQIKVGEIIGLAHGANKGRFWVKWTGQAGAPSEGQVGLQNIAPHTSLWDVALPAASMDSFGGKPKAAERRAHPRMKSQHSIELHPDGQAARIWGKVSDLSLGGCFVEMPMPLKVGTSLKVGLWVQENKVWVSAKVVNSRPGFGIGVQFTAMNQEDTDRLRSFLQSITRLQV